LLSVLVFMPPVDGSSTINIIWLFVTIILFYFFMTMYVSPFYALISELGHSPEERLQLSTMISITFALGFMTGSTAYGVSGFFEELLSPVEITAANPASQEVSVMAFQITMGIFAIVSLILMLLPVIFIQERRYTEAHVSEEGSFEALVKAFKNRDFRVFALSDLSYWVAMTFVQTGISYYVIMLLELEKGFATTLLMVMFIFSFIFYVPIGFVAKKFGKKRVLSIGFIIFIATAFLMSMWGNLPFPAKVQGYGLILIAALPMAIFGILPNAIVADIADADGIEKGNFKAAIFFGARTFMQKLGQSLSVFLFPIIITLNIGAAQRSAEAMEAGGQDLSSAPTVLGVRLTAILAGVGLIIGFILFLKYNEKHILNIISRREELSEEEAGEIARGE
jgi:Na+/melibiose symporter-like transporter